VLALLAFGLAATPAHATFSGPAGKIAYSDGTNIYSANADGSGVVQLTNDFPGDTFPAYSPDGNYIAFMSTRRHFSVDYGETNIYVMRSDGLGIREVWGDTCSTYPSWSPDGTKLVFARTGNGSCYSSSGGIAVVNLDGTGFTQLTSGDSNHDSFPVWSPDGTKIAFTRSNTIWVMNADGTGQVRISPPLAGCCTQAPDWSPDGSRIAFQGARACGGGCVAPDIWTMNPDGSNPTRLMDTIDRDMFPFWSPDGTKIAFESCTPAPCSSPSAYDGLYVMNANGSGKTLITHAALVWAGADWQAAVGPPLPPVPQQLDKIAFVSNRNHLNDGLYSGDDLDIWVMNPDGTRQKTLTFDSKGDYGPAWSPDGIKIAFHSNRDGGSEIYSMNADGTGITNLTQTAGPVEGPQAWSPDGTKIAYDRQDSTADETPDIWVMNADGTGQTFLAAGGLWPRWSPDGTKIAFNSRAGAIYKMKADGSDAVAVTTPPSGAYDEAPDWSPDGAKIAFGRSSSGSGSGIWIVNADGSDEHQITSSGGGPSWSPDGSRIAFGKNVDIWVMNADGTNQVDLTKEPLSDGRPDRYRPRGYARPKGASPLRLSLVPAYDPCTAPNRTHGAPLSFGSCAPPQLSSTSLTTGSPDANGRGARMNANLLLTVAPGNPATPADEADVQITTHVNDVANKDLTDYTGELRPRLSFQITDKQNSGPAPAATGVEYVLEFDVPCVSDPSPTAGSDCSSITTVDSIVPGAVKETNRAIWQSSGRVLVYDGGADGDGATTGDNTVFLAQGVFIP
jgi:Tol biopolymer transport system component